ncbi:NTPase KAP family P-loop domain-containing protein 1 [Aplochiton taeniatus]
MITKDLPADGIYAYALSKTLTKVSSPVTVGLYSSCQSRINTILRHLEVSMDQEAERREQRCQGRAKPRSVRPSLCSLLALIGRLIFYWPVRTEENQKRQNVRFIYVHFSAWHFAGSDLLWAGMVMRLCKAMQDSFGKLQLGLYRVVQYDEEKVEIRKKILKEGAREWRSKKCCCFPLWLLLLAVLLGAAAVLVLLVLFGFPKGDEDQGEGGDPAEGTAEAPEGGAGLLEGLAIAALGVPAAGALRFVFLMGKNLLFSQDLNIRRGMDNERVSSQLGFMNEVRKEMCLLSSFVRLMEVFERRQIRVVLKITHLDRCSPQKIVGVLDAINILLSEEDSPFISLLAVNPEVLVQQVDFADGCFSKEDRAYSFLNRIVTLGFTVPPLGDDSKRVLFHNLAKGQLEMGKDFRAGKTKQGSCKCCYSSNVSSMENGQMTTNEAGIPLIDKKHIKETAVSMELKGEEVEETIDSAFQSVLNSDGGNLNRYITDDTMSMRRVINSIRVTVVLLKAMKTELPPPSDIAAWVVLANHWPCRLSWILQCLEDDQQRAQIDKMADGFDSKTLWEIFSESSAELYLMKEQIEDLLEQDGDPEMFEMFLRDDFRFTVRDAEEFKLSTVNLDHSIRKELGRIRGQAKLKDCGWAKNLAPLAIRTVVNMSSEDVCKELKRLDFPDKYSDTIGKNDLSGKALVFGDHGELKQLLQMTFSEWTTFRLHFLGVPPRLRLQNKAAQPNPRRLNHSKHH